MPTRYTVVAGDCISSIARKNGFKHWRDLYDHPENADFRAKRPNPNVMAPGDVLVIPDKTPKSLNVATGARHTFVVNVAPVSLILELRNFDGSPMAGVKYKIEVADQRIDAVTGSDGRIEHGVYSVSTTGTLTVWMAGRTTPHIFDLHIGNLDPLTEPSGILQRLNNLGFQCGEGDTIDEDARRAIRAFQCEQGSAINGAIGDELRNHLLNQHGS